jgi:hypothetical protein
MELLTVKLGHFILISFKKMLFINLNRNQARVTFRIYVKSEITRIFINVIFDNNNYLKKYSSKTKFELEFFVWYST